VNQVNILGSQFSGSLIWYGTKFKYYILLNEYIFQLQMKTSYKDTVDTFNKLVHGNLTDYVTHFLNNIIENYDRFVKNLHITFMNSIEAMWDNMAQALTNYWSRILESIEPQILRSIHYVETTLWSVSAEIFGMYWVNY